MDIRKCNHSVLFLLNGEVQKLIEPNLHWEVERAERIQTVMEAYRTVLHVRGVPTSSQHRVEVEVRDGRLAVIEYATNMGDNSEVWFQKGSTVTLIESIVKALSLLLDGDGTVGIDAHPGNWCSKDGVNVAFVDFHPARLYLDGQFLVGFPQPTNEIEILHSRQRYYSPLGIIRLLRFNLIRNCGLDVESVLTSAMQRYLPESVFRRIAEQLLNLPDQRVRDTPVAQILEPFDLLNIDEVREIAMRVSRNGQRGFLTDVLRLTMVDYRISEEVRRLRLKEAKRLIFRVAEGAGDFVAG